MIATPESMAAYGTTLLVDFIAGGLYSWTGTTWTMLTPFNPGLIAVSN